MSRRHVEAHALASHGFVVLVRDDPGLLVDTTVVADDLVYVGTTFLAAPPAPLTGRVDVSKLGLAGHSRGGKASLLASEGGLKGKVKAWFGLDPVDTSLLGGGQQARDTIGSIGIPIAFLVRYLTAFFARELTGDAAVGATLDGAGGSVDIMTGLITRMNK